jgi:hypothetical protein
VELLGGVRFGRSSFATTIRVLEGLLAHERATGGSAESIAARRRGEEYLLERSCSGGRAPARWPTRPGCNSRFRLAGTTTCSVPWSTSAPPEIPRPAGGRSHPVAPIQTAARRHLAAGEHASRQGPLRARGRRRPAQPVEHATGSACPQLVRAVGRLNDHVGTLGHAAGGAGGRRQAGDLRCQVERAKGIEPSPRAWEAP